MLKLIFFTVLPLILIFKSSECVSCNGHQPTLLGQLRDMLLCHYDLSERPNQALKKPVYVTLKIHLKSFDFEESTNRPLLKLYSWMPISWVDEHLKWEPVEYDKIKKIQVSSKEIWMPDVALHNSDNGKSILSHTEVNCDVTFNGTVKCVLPVTFEVVCRPDYKKWPYGIQSCPLYFGSWMSTKDYIDYNNKSFIFKVTGAQKNLRWKIIQTKTSISTKTFNSREYSTLFVSLTLKRFPSMYEAYLLPALILMTVSNLMTFLIKLEHSHKMRFSIIFLVMLSHYLILSYFAWYLPNMGETVPDIMKFFKDSMIITMVSLLETILVQGVLEKYFPISVSIENFLRNLYESSVIGKALFVEFIPGSNIEDGNMTLEEAIKVTNSKKRPVECLLAQFLDRVAFSVCFITYFIYFTVIALDWM